MGGLWGAVLLGAKARYDPRPLLLLLGILCSSRIRVGEFRCEDVALSIPGRERRWLRLGPGESVLGSSARLGLSPAPSGTLGTSAPSWMATVPAEDPFLIEAERGKNHLGARLVAQCSQGYGGWVTPFPPMAILVPTGSPTTWLRVPGAHRDPRG